ncbi:hypothetical protein R5M92_08245 [Halomonas sp. Bachu 37]|uniref:hypothetical protein n=1 Tax=Halomonas kashgarensis TaxID=3084920 RepID=UPI0032163DD3
MKPPVQRRIETGLVYSRVRFIAEFTLIILCRTAKARQDGGLDSWQNGNDLAGDWLGTVLIRN